MKVALDLSFGDVDEREAARIMAEICKCLGVSKPSRIRLSAEDMPPETAAVVQSGFAIGKAQLKARKSRTK